MAQRVQIHALSSMPASVLLHGFDAQRVTRWLQLMRHPGHTRSNTYDLDSAAVNRSAALAAEDRSIRREVFCANC